MRKRKILSFLLASSLMSAWGQSVDDLRVTLHLKDATVKTLFEALHEQTSLNFVYNNEQTKTLPLITIQVKDKSVEEVLKQVFAQTAFSYEVSDNTVTLFRSPSGQRRVQKVSGVVKDAHGFPLPGANISVRGGKIGCTTDINGAYTLEVPVPCHLMVSFIGMETQVIKYKGESVLDVTMHEDSEQIEEVVVNGYYTKNKSSFTGNAVRLLMMN